LGEQVEFWLVLEENGCIGWLGLFVPQILERLLGTSPRLRHGLLLIVFFLASFGLLDAFMFGLNFLLGLVLADSEFGMNFGLMTFFKLF